MAAVGEESLATNRACQEDADDDGRLGVVPELIG